MTPEPSAPLSKDFCPKCGSVDPGTVGLKCLDSFNTRNMHSWHSTSLSKQPEWYRCSFCGEKVEKVDGLGQCQKCHDGLERTNYD